MEQKILDLVKQPVMDIGFRIVKITWRDEKILEVLIEQFNGDKNYPAEKIYDSKVQLGDCKLVSKTISTILEVNEVIKGEYSLEVSSAGMERPLLSIDDYERFCGHDIKLHLRQAFRDKLTYKGRILRIEGDKIILKCKNIELDFAFENIKKANLILTEEIFRKLLKAASK